MTGIAVQPGKQHQQAGVTEPTPAEFIDKEHDQAGDDQQQDEPVDTDGGTVIAAAGATIGEVHRAAEAAGWSYGVDLAARDSATVGGTTWLAALPWPA